MTQETEGSTRINIENDVHELFKEVSERSGASRGLL